MFVEAIVTFLIVLAGIWFLTEVLQGIWYENVVSPLVPRLLAAAVLFTLLQLYLRIRLESLMDASLPWAVVSGIVWAVVFYGLFQFSAGHALGLGVGGMLLLTCLSGLVSDGFQGVGAGPARPAAAARKRPPATPKGIPRVGSGYAPFQLPTIDSRGAGGAGELPGTVTSPAANPPAEKPEPTPGAGREKSAVEGGAQPAPGS